jgi:uncharacterized membrane protein
VSRKSRYRNQQMSTPAQIKSTALRIETESHSFSGPLPPPDALERYNLVVPNAAERIITMAESQHSHRQELEKSVVLSNIHAQRLGTILGFIVAMAVVLGGMWLIHEGRSIAGLTATLTTLAALVGVFVYSKHEQQKDLAKKSEALVSTSQRR